jgi:hypothetical protein
MSEDDERPLAPDLFTAPPAAPQRSLATPGGYQYAAAGVGHQFAQYAPMPITRGRQKPGLLRRILPYIALAWGGLTILFTLINGFGSADSGAYRGGQVLGLLLAIALFVGGYQEIESHHLRRVRWLPWLLAVETVMLALAIAAIVELRPAYPPNVRTAFINSCEVHGNAPSYCGCLLGWFESHRSLAEFEADANGTAPAARQSDVSDASASCMQP